MENQLQVIKKQSAITIRQQGMMFMLTDLDPNTMTLTGAENKIVDARKTGIAFCDMNEKEEKVAATAIIFTIVVISVCQLPTNPTHVEVLEREFLKLIKEYGYSNFTAEEILTAFRMNANLELEERI